MFFIKSKNSKKKAMLLSLKEQIKTIIGEKAPLYSFEFNLNRHNERVVGLCAVTDTLLVVAFADSKNKQSLEKYELCSLHDISCTKNYGSFSLEARDEQDALIELCRANITLENGLIGCAAFLKKRDCGKSEQANASQELTRVCPKCGKPYRRGSRTCLNCGGAKRIILRLARLLLPQYKTLVPAVILFFVVCGLQLVVPEINRFFIDERLKAANAAQLSFASLLVVVCALIFTNLLVMLFSVFRSFLMIKTSNKLLLKIRSMLFDAIQRMSVGKIGERSAGDLISRITNDTRVVNEFITYDVAESFQNFVMLVGVLAIMLIQDPVMTLLAVCPLPLVIFIFAASRRLMQRVYRKEWFCDMSANNVMHDIFQGIKVVKAFGTEKQECEKYTDIVKNQRKIREKNETLWAFLIPPTNFLMELGGFIVMFYVGNKILNNSMTLGELTKMTSYVGMLYAPLNYFSMLPRKLIRAGTSLSKVFELIDEEPDVVDAADAAEHEIVGNVQFKNVCFSYNRHDEVLTNISFEAKKGEMIGIVGHSGAGKSTLINLIMRLYDADSGEILIDGKSIKSISQSSLRRQIGVVLQETYLFGGTIYDNIAYAKQDASMDEVVRAAKLSGAHSFIIKLPDAYNTVVGERGYNLSGGERQRIAIARAILVNPKILILDEATSALDTKTEKTIQDALAMLTQNRTTFAIAHRLSTLRNATRLIVLNNGELAEVGTHDELLRKKGIYYELVMAQRQMAKGEVK